MRLSQSREFVTLGLAVAVLVSAPDLRAVDMRECDLTTTGKIPLPDAGGLFYRRVGLTPEYASEAVGADWRLVGMYPGGSSTRPTDHEAAGLAIAAEIQPIGGRLVMISIGMSNTFQEFGRFESRAESSAATHPDLVIVNAAQGSRPADAWTSPDDEVWDTVDDRLSDAGLTPDQVQVAWIKHAVRSPMFEPLDFPEHPEILQGLLEDVVKSLKIRYPNVRLTYLSSRTRAYNSNQMAQSPEPHSYEGGFAVQWMIERQLAGDADLRYDGVDPPAPWLSWGPYLWTDGLGAPSTDPPAPFEARSDGFVWTCADVQEDGVHPSPPTPDAGEPTGEFKIGDQLMAFFSTDVTTTPWFLGQVSGGPAVVELTANGTDVSSGQTLSGEAPFTVALNAVATGAVDTYTWTYDDGTFSYNPSGNSEGSPWFDDSASPTKVFEVPGTYDVRLAVSDVAGNTTLISFPVEVDGEVGGGGDPPDPPENEPPVAVPTASPFTGQAPLTVTFDASGSFDPDGTIVAYDWDFGDGATASGEQVEHVYVSRGRYTVVLTVTDDDDATGTAEGRIRVR